MNFGLLLKQFVSDVSIRSSTADFINIEQSFLDEKPDENKQVDLGDIPLGWETCNEISYLPTLCITDLTKAFVESTLMSKPMENKSDDKCMTTPQLCSFRKSKQNRSFTYSRMVL